MSIYSDSSTFVWTLGCKLYTVMRRSKPNIDDECSGLDCVFVPRSTVSAAWLLMHAEPGQDCTDEFGSA